LSSTTVAGALSSAARIRRSMAAGGIAYLRYKGGQWRRQQSTAATLQRQLLQAFDRAGKAGRKAQSAQPLRVVPAIGRELLEQVRLELRRGGRRLAGEGLPPAARDAAVERPPEDPFGEMARQPEAEPRRPRRVPQPAGFVRAGCLQDCARQLLERQRDVVGDVEGAAVVRGGKIGRAHV